MERFGDGLRDGGADLDAACGLVVGDLQAEGVEDLALDLRWGLLQGVGEVRDSREECSGVLVRAGVDRGGGEAAELDLGRVLGFSELGDALADQVGLDPAFEGGDLQPGGSDVARERPTKQRRALGSELQRGAQGQQGAGGDEQQGA